MCGVVVCVRCGDTLKNPCVRSKRPRVYRHHAQTCFNMCAWCRHTWGRVEWTHGGKGGWEGGVVVSLLIFIGKPSEFLTFVEHLDRMLRSSLVANLLLTVNGPVHLKKPLDLSLFSSLRKGRENVPDSSNHSPCLIKLFNPRHTTQHTAHSTQHTAHSTAHATQEQEKRRKKDERATVMRVMVSPVVCPRLF